MRERREENAGPQSGPRELYPSSSALNEDHGLVLVVAGWGWGVREGEEEGLERLSRPCRCEYMNDMTIRSNIQMAAIAHRPRTQNTGWSQHYMYMYIHMI